MPRPELMDERDYYDMRLTIRREDGAVETVLGKRVHFHQGAIAAMNGGTWRAEDKSYELYRKALELARDAEVWAKHMEPSL